MMVGLGRGESRVAAGPGRWEEEDAIRNHSDSRARALHPGLLTFEGGTTAIRRLAGGVLVAGLGLGACFGSIHALSSPAWGVPAGPGSPVPGATTPATRLVEIEARLEALGAPDSALEPTNARRREILEQLRRALELRVLEGRQSEIAPANEQAAELWLEEARHPPPYSLRELDRVLDQLDVVEARYQALTAAAATVQAAVEAAALVAREREQDRRRAREAAGDPPHSGETTEALELAALESELAAERQLLATDEAGRVRAELSVLEEDLARFRTEVARIETQLAPSKEELDQTLAALEAEEAAARERLTSDRQSLAKAEERWQRKAAAATADSPATDSDPTWWSLELARQRVRLGEERLDRLRRQATAWTDRHALLEPGLDASHRVAQADTAESARRDLSRQLSQVRAQGVALRGRLADSAGSVRDIQNRLLSLLDESAADIELALLLEDRLARDRLRSSATSRIEDSLTSGRERLKALWRSELAVVDDRSITVGKVAAALATFALGFLFAKLFAGWLGRTLLPRLGLDSGAAATFQTLAFYGLLVTFLLTSLRLVNIPLTAFTVLGGVIAIGVGFGSQNVVGNFISGLILMAERPVKVGDIVQLETTAGRVERIGARSTRISTSDGTHLIVPNSSLLEQNVINWTLSDPVVRGQVDVGVAYGSPTRETARCIERAMLDTARVLTHPPPEVRLTDFGDNAIAFRGLFWMYIVQPADRRRVESEVRHRIDELLREAAIVIAFPQRDVHLDSPRPLEVRVLTAPPPLPTTPEDRGE